MREEFHKVGTGKTLSVTHAPGTNIEDPIELAKVLIVVLQPHITFEH